MDHTERLPDEPLDAVLNGADSRGHAFVHPTRRVLARLVSKRWLHIVEGVADSQGMRSRLTRDPCVRRALSDGADAFCAGRLVAASGIVRFVRESRGLDGAHLNRNVRKRISAYMAVVSHVIGRRAQRERLGAIATVVISGNDVLWTKAQYKVLPIISHAFALVGGAREAIAFFAAYKNSYGGPIKFIQRYYYMLCSVVNVCCDDPRALLSAMATVTVPHDEDGTGWRLRESYMLTGASALWRALARTASIKCIALLRQICEHSDKKRFTEVEPSLQETLLDEVAGAPEYRVHGATRLLGDLARVAESCARTRLSYHCPQGWVGGRHRKRDGDDYWVRMRSRVATRWA